MDLKDMILVMENYKGSVKVVEEIAPVLKNGGLVVRLCKLIVNIFKGDGL